MCLVCTQIAAYYTQHSSEYSTVLDSSVTGVKSSGKADSHTGESHCRQHRGLRSPTQGSKVTYTQVSIEHLNGDPWPGLACNSVCWRVQVHYTLACCTLHLGGRYVDNNTNTQTHTHTRVRACKPTCTLYTIVFTAYLHLLCS